MWAQLITMRAKPGREQDLMAMHERIQALEEPGSGLIRWTIGWDQKDARTCYVLVLFESEEKARSREHDPRRQEAVGAVMSDAAEVLDGPPEFVDIVVEREVTP
jgi:antibiotic biosynthesis monooxygenase (ABM) superfamily enzyme